ncbi:uncharacterized protein THITE_114873 [Thermothielavioides terrestris NRRL 8126]|uniref:Uncharacterized protein n=1 Tax=Thermothielavioides terrestris (strain ATCC 38088 / NRRL 8126) TaxID=578455 RepID=G2RFE8_THETT|nr:uncharacterized protein THITE_114873 [Thermothielavioides terrestris NRRL 8126]AEO70431.1 hypothetical protein THITE_114873 [Thermothielavioides terrestris NRRL 8126]
MTIVSVEAAYAEGVEVLYATNTFFSESDALFDHLVCARPGARHLLLPERLASIKSLELRWEQRISAASVTGFQTYALWPSNVFSAVKDGLDLEMERKARE